MSYNGGPVPFTGTKILASNAEETSPSTHPQLVDSHTSGPDDAPDAKMASSLGQSPFTISSTADGYSPATTAILNRISLSNPSGVPNYETVRKHVLETIKTTTTAAPSSPNIPSAKFSSIAVAPSSDQAIGLISTPPRGGRGRGRPRSSHVGSTQSRTSITSNKNVSPALGRGSGRRLGRGGRRARGRRKIKAEDGESDGASPSHGADSRSEDIDSGSENGDYTSLPTKSRSGRKIQRPTHFDPATKAPARRRGPYRRTVETGSCKHCGRGAWTPGNKIVFCDGGCQGAWHQLCHWPVIGKEVLEEEGKEWVCSACKIEKEGIEKDVNLDTLIGGEGLTNEEKRKKLVNLTPAMLVEILLRISASHPTLPLFPPLDPRTIQTNLSGLVDPRSSHYETDPNSAAALYPPPGSGIQLPPESMDLEWLTDGGDTEVFSHVYVHA